MRGGIAGLLVVCAGCSDGGDSGSDFRGLQAVPQVVSPQVLPAEVQVQTPGRVDVVPVPLLEPIVRGPRQVDVYVQEEAVVDILWVVDNSASVSNERSRIADELGRFLDTLVASDVDFHLGITSTDLTSSGADEGRLRGRPPVIDGNTPNPEGVFRDAVAFPEDIDIRLEEGLAAMRTALTPPLVDGPNAGFLRDDAALAVIVVSDEDDGSLGTTEQYVRFLDTLKGPGREVNVSFSAVVGPQPEGCIPEGDELIFGAEADPGDRYLEVVRATGGLEASICSASFGAFVDQLATSLSGLRRFFPLSAPPAPGSLEVRVDDRVVNARDWGLRSEERAVVFEGTVVPAPGSEVRITYDVAL